MKNVGLVVIAPPAKISISQSKMPHSRIAPAKALECRAGIPADAPDPARPISIYVSDFLRCIRVLGNEIGIADVSQEIEFFVSAPAGEVVFLAGHQLNQSSFRAVGDRVRRDIRRQVTEILAMLPAAENIWAEDVLSVLVAAKKQTATKIPRTEKFLIEVFIKRIGVNADIIEDFRRYRRIRCRRIN